MSEGDNASQSTLAPARGLARLILTNISLIVALMVYLGWIYENEVFSATFS